MNKLYKKTHSVVLRMLLLLFIFISYTSAAINIDGAQKKVILIGVDGVQYEKLKKLPTPNFDRLYVSQVYAGGIMNDVSQQKTYSSPGWSTILTGVWANQHGVTSNSDKVKSKVPSLFDWLHLYYPEASMGGIIRWGTIYNNLYSDADFLNKKLHVKSGDQEAVDQFIHYMQSQPDFAFLHLDDVDHAGHAHGFGPEYNNAILVADKLLGDILDFMENSPIMKEDYLIVVTTDHGRDKQGSGHGGQSFSERTAFYASNKKSLHDNLITENKSKFTALPQTYVANSILQHFNISLVASGCPEDNALCVFKQVQQLNSRISIKE